MTTKQRGKNANKAYQAWIPLIADELAMTRQEATRYLKHSFGLPILFEHEYLGPLIGNGLQVTGYFKKELNEQLLEMDKLPVTRLFDSKMHTEYRNQIQNYFGSVGLKLDYHGW